MVCYVRVFWLGNTWFTYSPQFLRTVFQCVFKMRMREYIALMLLSCSRIWNYLADKIRINWIWLDTLLSAKNSKSLHKTVKDNILWVCPLCSDKGSFLVLAHFYFHGACHMIIKFLPWKCHKIADMRAGKIILHAIFCHLAMFYGK